MEQDAALGEEGLEVAILHEGHHEEQQSDGAEEQPRKGVGVVDQQLVARARPLQQPRRRLRAVPDLRRRLQVEHHQHPYRRRHQRMQHADDEEPRRRGRRRIICH